MVKKYSIDINHVKELKKILLEYYPENENEIKLIDYFINRLENNFKEIPPKNAINNLREDLIFYDFYKQYYPYIKTFSKNGIYVYELNEPNYQKIELNDDDTLTIAGDFFNQLNQFFSQKFDDFKRYANDHLEFIKPNPYTNGEIHFLKSFNEAFVYVPNYKNFTKVSILIHELEHVIDSYTNPEFYSNILIRESTAMFMEIISCDYLKDILNLNEDHEIRKFYIYANNKIEAENIYSKTKLLYLLKKHQKLDNRILKKILMIKYKINEKFIEAASNETLVENYYYQLSFLIAVELYYIYIKDKDLALHIVKDIIINGNDNNFLEILNKYNINLTRNIFNYENDLCLKLNI